MSPLIQRLLRILLHAKASKADALNGFVDSLLQTFENCRNGVSDAMLAEGEGRVAAFFTELYEKEIPRLKSVLRLNEPYVPKGTGEALLGEVDGLVRKVLIPGYVRLSAGFTRRERNDFYLLRDFHGIERIGWSMLGMAIGAFVVWAPFIPMTAKEWVLPFFLGGLFFPDLRRFLSIRRYEAELNRVVERVDREIGRLDLVYLTAARGGDNEPMAAVVAEPSATAEQEEEMESRRRPRTRTPEGGTH